MNIPKLLRSERFIFISPHLDDAILSAGALINHLSSNRKIEIITVFTRISQKNTKATSDFISACHYSDGRKLFIDRRMEDINVCRHLKVNYRHLGFTDALWRADYTSMEDVFANIASDTVKEQKLEKSIVKKLKKAVGNNKNTAIFAPLSIGNHVDHRIVNKICRDNFKNLIYWEDYPYNLKSSWSEELVKKNNMSHFEFDKDLNAKDDLIRFYKSQIPVLFSDNLITPKKEKYYFNNSSQEK